MKMKTELLNLTPAQFCDITDACTPGRNFAVKYSTMGEIWDNCPNPSWPMWILQKLETPEISEKLRLFAVWCARNTPLANGGKTGDLLTDPRSVAALEVAERFANGGASEEELSAACNAAFIAADSAGGYAAFSTACNTAYVSASIAADNAAYYAASCAACSAAPGSAFSTARHAAYNVASLAQAIQFRKAFANPFDV